MPDNVAALRRALAGLAPEHDTPVGVVHPYWARKPMNVVQTVIEHLSKSDGTVVDPFMGSGTILFAALKSGRRTAGSDISPLSFFIVHSLLDVMSNWAEVLPELESILARHRQLTLPWFEVSSTEYVERTRYSVVGDFANGNFELAATEVVTKAPAGDRWRARRVYDDPDTVRTLTESAGAHEQYLKSPVDFSSVDLAPNSRIAIPRGAKLSHYFTTENQASINVLLTLIESSPLYATHPSALKLILSASLPLLRLSDKKASSQWPFWRPKSNLTSRNPVLVLGDRLVQLRKLAEWGSENLPDLVSVDDPRYELFNLPAQQFVRDAMPEGADLVLTDPPYGDQVPYVEYSFLWNDILGLVGSSAAFEHEVVKSDAKHRKDDSNSYHSRLREVFLANARLVNQEGYLAWFYQDQDLSCWDTVHRAARESDLVLIDVIPIPKQRRSLKTLTSPNATLDGDLLCVYKRTGADVVPSPAQAMSLSQLEESVRRAPGTYFDRYAVMIDLALKNDRISDLATKHRTVKRALNEMVG